MRKGIVLGIFILLVIAGAFRATHHPVYGDCKQVGADKVCKLIKWEGNK